MKPQLTPEYWDSVQSMGSARVKHVQHTLGKEIEKKTIEDNIQVSFQYKFRNALVQVSISIS